jgi:hypothetical protein
MRRKKAFKRGRVVAIAVACSIGYVVGNWHADALRSPGLSAAQTVSLRFPLDWQDAPAVQAASDAATGTIKAAAVGGSRLALLSPAPMVPQTAVPQTPIQTAAVAGNTSVAASDVASAHRPMAAAMPAPEAKPAAAPSHRRVDRPGYVLNDAQISSIKQRLHLTADQEQMWPAVEAALRNIAYARAREAHRRGAPASATQLAAADPDSVEVQGLKSAAIPLLMSFNDEQKDEVRNLAHVMGLDQLASQF